LTLLNRYWWIQGRIRRNCWLSQKSLKILRIGC